MTWRTPREGLYARESAPQGSDGELEGAGRERAADGHTAFPAVQGRCPACRGASLFLGAGGHITCSRLDCPNPVAVDDLLNGEHTNAAAELARLREGEQPLGENQHPATASPAQWLWMWNEATPERRLAWAGRIIEVSQRATACFLENHPARIQELEHQLAALREVARGYCPHCGRGDASPTAQQWEDQRQRADQAEELLAIAHATSNRAEAERARLAAAIARVRALCSPEQNSDQLGYLRRSQDILTALDEPPAHNAGPTVAECAEADRRWWGGEKTGEQ